MSTATAIALEAHGFGWTAAGAWASFLVLMGIVVRQLGPWKRQVTEAETKLRDDLIKRVDKLERTLERKDAIHNAERRVDRHRMANITQCFDSLLMLIEMAPDKAMQAIAMIKEQRSRQVESETSEKAALLAITIGFSADDFGGNDHGSEQGTV